MNSALLKLLLLQGRGLFRRMLRGAGTPKRMVLFGVGIAVVILWLGPTLMAASWVKRSDPLRVQATMPLVLLGVCLLTIVTSAGDKAIAFTPGEVDFLFSAPFTRRELIAFKLAKSGAGALLTGLFLSVALLRHARWWPACYVGIVLSLLFVQLFSINAVILGQTAGARLYSAVRRLAVLIVVVLGWVAVREFTSLGMDHRNLMDTLNHLRDSSVGGAILTPFDVFGQTMTARNLPALASWGVRAAILDGLLLILVFALDSAYAQAAMSASNRRYAQIQRIRSGSFLSIGVNKTPKYHLPRAPWLAGAGPVIWRQAVSASRSARGLLLLLLIAAVGAGPALASAAASGRPQKILPTLVIMLLWLTILIATMLKFDFRGDLDQMEVLKSLPISPAAIATGQLIVPSVMLAVVHVGVLMGAAHALPSLRVFFVIASILALPVNLLLFAIENLVFLLFPARPAAASPGDFQVLGRQVVVMALKMIVLAIACTPPLVVAIFVWVLAGRSPLALVLVAAPLLLLETAALVPLLAWAFNRFDPSTDTPA